MILIERSRLDLNAPVDSILPYFGKIQVLEGFNGDISWLRAPKSRGDPAFHHAYLWNRMRILESRRVALDGNDGPGVRSADSQRRAGVLNAHFWFDPPGRS